MKQKLLFVVGARPNFMKVAPVMEAVRTQASDRFDAMLVHTGQHYDTNMSDVFFADLDMPAPDIFLGIGSGSHAEQTAKVMIEMEQLIAKEQPALVLVAGDVNSTLASTLVAAKSGTKLAHIESGLRSFDRGMPEEINRIVADEFSDFLFVTEASGLKHLKDEGISEAKTFFVGNTMIDSVVKYLPAARERFRRLAEKLDIMQGGYALATLHRPSNVDDPVQLRKFVELFKAMSKFAPRILFPIHPRTRKRLEDFGMLLEIEQISGLRLLEPVGYLDFLALQQGARVVLTDSGGVQEETTALKVPCITMRENTERPSTVEVGSNLLLGLDMTKVLHHARAAFNGNWKRSSIPELWDGHAAERIVTILKENL